jgi:hypothetical protein
VSRAFLLAVIAALVAGAAAVALEQPPVPAYVAGDGARVGLVTTARWRLVGQPGHARAVEPLPVSTTDKEEQSAAFIWAPKCSAKRQTVHFTREIDIAGPLGKVTASIRYLTGSGFAIASSRLLVNHKLVLKGGRAQSGASFVADRSAAVGAAFVFGSNRLDLIVTKPASPKGAKKCNTNAKNKVAIGAALQGDFETDLALIEPAPADTYVPSSSDDVAGQASFSVTNKGPGGVQLGLFTLGVTLPSPGGGGATLLQIDSAQPPFDKSRCEIVPRQSAGEWDVTCYLVKVPAGQSGSLAFSYSSQNAKTGSNGAAHFDWRVSGYGQDPDLANNHRTAAVWFCQYGVGSDGKSCKSS